MTCKMAVRCPAAMGGKPIAETCKRCMENEREKASVSNSLAVLKREIAGELHLDTPKGL